MEESFSHLLNGDEDDIIAKVQEESLRFYNEVELPRLELEQRILSDNTIQITEPSSSRIEKDETILYEGEEARGFHLAAGSSYIYPTNYPLRQYQEKITRTAIFKNTLVCLPTGLGKTFIAAVVMYNFYRWYPRGKVVFMAPTRPLVAQQIKACYHIMNIPLQDTTEMTGMNSTEQRRSLWRIKRVFYLTPQVMVNDLKSSLCPADLIKCIVFDEAHRAVKDYAYCQVVKLMSSSNSQYRTLALSATPGNDINAVQQVVRNLNISVLEIRGEDALDVAPYTHSRSVENIVVELSPNILRVKEDFLQIYDKYARRLKDFKALSNNISFLSKFQILKACEKFRTNPPRGISPTVLGSLICDFTVCMSLAHSLDLLQSYGLRAFYSYLTNEGGEKCKAATSRLRGDEDLQKMLSHLRDILYPEPANHIPYTWSHPKLQKLVAAINVHFKSSSDLGESTKAIVFCQYRVVVNEIVDILKKCPHIKPAIFVGQSGGKERGMPQVKQIQIMKDFREGRLNCLVATCVAEEGLDIGDVDLILLMETHKSPVRLVQRLGRTGRKRKGNCIVFVTKGRELEKFHTAMAARKAYVNNIVNSDSLKSSLCQHSPLMIPSSIVPQLQLVHINAVELVLPARNIKNKQVDIRSCFGPQQSPYLTPQQFNEIKTTIGSLELILVKLPKTVELWHRTYDVKMPLEELINKDVSQLSQWNDWNFEKQPTHVVGHSSETELLCHLLHLARNTQELAEIYRDCEDELEEKIRGEAEIQKNKYNKEEVELSKISEKEEKVKDLHITKGRKQKKIKQDNMKNIYNTLDIRSCMAVAANRAKVSKVHGIINFADDESPAQYLSNSTSESKCIASLDFLKDFLWLLDLDNKDLQLHGEINKLSQLFDNSRLDKYMVPKKFNVNSLRIVPDISLPNLNDLENMDSFLSTVSSKNNPLLPNELNEFGSKVISLPVQFGILDNEISSIGSDELACVDDLLLNGTDSDENCLPCHTSEALQYNFRKDKFADSINLKLKEPGKNVTPLKNHDRDLHINGGHAMESTTHLNKVHSEKEFADIPETSKNLKTHKFEALKLVSSTPLQSKATAYKSITGLSTQNCLDPVSEEDVWNLSDLLGSDTENNEETATTSAFANSTMIGLTQMVSQIEKMKHLNKETDLDLVSTSVHPFPKVCPFPTPGKSFLSPLELGSVNVELKEVDVTNEDNSIMFSSSKSKTTYKHSLSQNELIQNSLLIKKQRFKPNFNVLKYNSGNVSLDESLISEFAFTSHKSQISSKYNFKTFRRKFVMKKDPVNDSNNFPKLRKSYKSISKFNLYDSNTSIADENLKKLPSSESEKITKEEETVDHYKEKRLSQEIIILDESEDEDVFEKKHLKFTRETKDIILRNNSTPAKKYLQRRLKNENCSANGFIEKEAEVSGTVSSDDSDNSSLDDLDESFINDESHNTNNVTLTDYLRSVKSPKGGGNFKIPIYTVCNNEDVYSQKAIQDSKYVNDSFCVSTSSCSENSEISQLDLAERLLEQRKRRNYKKFSSKKKRRRIVSPENSCDMDLNKSMNCEDDSDGFIKIRTGRRIILSDSDPDSPFKKDNVLSHL